MTKKELVLFHLVKVGPTGNGILTKKSEGLYRFLILDRLIFIAIS